MHELYHTRDPFALFICRGNTSDKIKKKCPSLSEEALQRRLDGITYSVRQAREFFSSSDQVSLLTRPLLLSYGMLNLGKALVFYKSSGNTDFKSHFKSHGLNFLACASDQSLEDECIEIKGSGTYPEISLFFGQQAYPKKCISLKGLLSQLPDLANTYNLIYGQGSDVIRLNEYSITYSIQDRAKYSEKIKRIEQYLTDNGVGKYAFCFGDCVSNHFTPPAGKTFQDLDLLVESICGVNYFRIFPAIDSQPLILKEASILYLLTFSYGMLARYQAARWGKYIDPNTSHEAEIIRKSLYVCKIRYLQLIVNYLFETEFQFRNSIEPNSDRLHKEIEQIIERRFPDELKKYL